MRDPLPSSKQLVKTIRRIKTKRNLKNFLEGILTPEELYQIDQRLRVVKMLKAKVPQHEIARILRVGVATVTRGSKMIQTGHFKYIQNTKEWWA